MYSYRRGKRVFAFSSPMRFTQKVSHAEALSGLSDKGDRGTWNADALFLAINSS